MQCILEHPSDNNKVCFYFSVFILSLKESAGAEANSLSRPCTFPKTFPSFFVSENDREEVLRVYFSMD